MIAPRPRAPRVARPWTSVALSLLLALLGLVAVAGADGASAGDLAGRPRWSAREGIEWFKSRHSCSTAAAVEVGPSGRVFIATRVGTDRRHSDVLVSARRATDGELLWRRRFDGGRVDGAEDLVVGADGTVFVLGTVGELTDEAAPRALLVLAYSGADGTLRWSRRLTGTDGRAEGVGLTLAPDGSRLYVAGSAYRPDSTDDRTLARLLVAALAPVDGSVLWQVVPPGPDALPDEMSQCDESPLHVVDATSDVVLVTLEGQVGSGPVDVGEGKMTTVALEAATGAVRWWRSIRGYGYGAAVRATPDGGTAIVAGSSGFATLAAYDVSTGEALWRTRVARRRAVAALVLSSNGRRAYVAGSGIGPVVWTASFGLTDGSRRWDRLFRDEDTHHTATGIALSLDGSHAFVTTWSCTGAIDDPNDDLPTCLRDYAVLRYATVGGRGGPWASYSGPFRGGWEIAEDLSIGGNGRVYVTGISQDGPAPNICGRYACRIDYDVATVAFR